MRKSIRAWMTVTLLVSVGSLILIGIFMLDFLMERSLQTQFDQALKTKVDLLTMFPEVNREGIDLEFTDHYMPEFEHAERGEYYQIWLRGGAVLSKSKSLGNNKLPLKYGTIDQPFFWNITLPNGHPGRAIGVGFLPSSEDNYVTQQPGNENSFAMILVFARDRTPLDNLLDHVRWSIIVIGLIMLLLTVWIVNRALQKGLEPISRLTKEMEKMEADSLTSVRISPETLPTELSPIAIELNLLAGRLNDAFKREQRLTADMAHEMNTPLAELRSAAEVALKWPDDPLAVKGLARQTLNTVSNLQKVTHTLLMLSRQKNEVYDDLQSVNISALWEAVQAIHAPRAEERHIKIDADIPPNIEFQSNPELIKIILSNILDNAISYSQIEATIYARLSTSEKDCWQFSIENPNTTLQPKDLKHIFDPLWQHDNSRSDSHHAGLGLSLVKTIAARLKLDVHAHLSSPNIFCIVLTYPSRKG